MKAYRYIVELQEGCWLAPWSGDPGRTLDISAATVFQSREKAERAIKAARRHRKLTSPRVVPVFVQVTEVVLP